MRSPWHCAGSAAHAASPRRILSDVITVYNNVRTIEIITQPLLYPTDYIAPISFKPVLGGAPRLFYQQPKVRVLDYNGDPMSQKVVCCAPPRRPTAYALIRPMSGLSLRTPIFLLLRTAPKDAPPSPRTANHQPPTANCQPAPTPNRRQPPTIVQ